MQIAVSHTAHVYLRLGWIISSSYHTRSHSIFPQDNDKCYVWYMLAVLLVFHFLLHLKIYHSGWNKLSRHTINWLRICFPCSWYFCLSNSRWPINIWLSKSGPFSRELKKCAVFIRLCLSSSSVILYCQGWIMKSFGPFTSELHVVLLLLPGRLISLHTKCFQCFWAQRGFKASNASSNASHCKDS